LAAWRETNDAATTTPRSKSRSPTHPNRSRRAAEPQSAHLKRGPLATPRPSAPERDAQPSSASRQASGTPQTSLRLCASARDKRRHHDHPPLEEPIADTPEQVAQSRRAAERSPQARSFGDTQTVGTGAGRPAQLRVAPSVGDTPDLSAPLRLCARQTTTPRPPPARRADRRHTRTGRAEPQSAHLKRGPLATPRPSAPERDAQPSSASRQASGTPQTSLRLCASARDKRRRHDHPPLEEPIADTPGQVAQSRRAAERSPQARSLATPQTSLRLCASARDKRRRPTTPRSKSRSPPTPRGAR
jgi:hypothetical protein